MDPYIILLSGAGIVVLLAAWLPMLLKELPLSLPIICVGLGVLVFVLPAAPGVAPHPSEYLKLTERLTEFVVIVALMGAGLKLDRALSWSGGALTWRLLGLAMPLTIVVLAGLAHALLGVGLAAALLLGAALAPTDPVLASDIQVGPPGQGVEDEVRFSLTSEAGLNDGLAFPFVNLAIALALAAQGTEGGGEDWFYDWVAIDVVWKLAAGLVIGWAVGRGLGWLTFKLPNRTNLSGTGDGFVALGIMALSYGLTEMAHGYGFLAVFVAAVAFRATERHHHYIEKLHEFIEQLERLLMVLLLVAFGAALGGGGVLRDVSWPVVAFAVLALFLVRPAIGWISLLGRKEPADEKAVIAFFGIRGIGSAYYLAYALGRADFESPNLLWSALALTVLISIVLHGVTVTPVMLYLDRRRERQAAEEV